MAGVSAPCVMVSSTYYDLRQVRTDLEEFLSRNLGYQPLLSEFPSFPVDPDKTTIENCRIRVEQNADILVLVIGGRYGSLDSPSNKSVTNLEYLTARAKGIPIYAFVEKRIVAVLPLWEANPNSDFSKVVDNPRLFEFVKDVRTKDGVWTFEFETAQDIVTTLRSQFAHLFRESVRQTFKLLQSGFQNTLSGLRGKSFALALERPAAWEYRLFCQVLEDEIVALDELKRRYEAGIAFGPGERASLLSLESWFTPRKHEMQRLTNALTYAINIRLQEAFGAPGQAGNVEQIVSVARLVGEAYREALEWSFRVRRTTGHEGLGPVVDAMARFPDDLLAKVESLGSPTLRRIEDALTTATADKPVTIMNKIDIEISNSEEFHKALQQLKSCRSERQLSQALADF